MLTDKLTTGLHLLEVRLKDHYHHPFYLICHYDYKVRLGTVARGHEWMVFVMSHGSSGIQTALPLYITHDP